MGREFVGVALVAHELVGGLLFGGLGHADNRKGQKANLDPAADVPILTSIGDHGVSPQ